MIESTEADNLNYRLATAEEVTCLSCVLKKSVPYMWCWQIGKAANPLYRCDQHTPKEGE